MKKVIKVIKIDAEKCNGCRACEAICSAFHAEPRYSSTNPAKCKIAYQNHKRPLQEPLYPCVWWGVHACRMYDAQRLYLKRHRM